MRERKKGTCKKSEPKPETKPELTEKEMRAWRDTSEKLSAALELLENYPVPYPPECLPAVIF